MILELYLLHRKKYWGVFFLGLAYFFWHTATFFFVPGVAILYFMFEGFYGRKYAWKLVVFSVIPMVFASVATLFFAPGLFSYMKDVIFGVFYDTIIGNKVNISEGVELYAINTFDFIKNDPVIMIMFVFVVVLEIYRYVLFKKGKFSFSENEKEKLPLRGTLFFLSILFLAGSFVSLRNIDFFIFFSAAYIAISINRALQGVVLNDWVVRKSLPLATFFIIGYLTISAGLFLQNGIASTGRYDQLKGAAQWLNENTEKQSVVFNTEWSWFAQLFFYDQNNFYVAGIEPRFMYDYNKEMYWIWFNISKRGYVCDKEVCNELQTSQNQALKDQNLKAAWISKEAPEVAYAVKNSFKSNYILTSVDTKNLNTLLDDKDYFEKVYDEDGVGPYIIYKVK
ncbi:MAG TPA: hypothetical protein VF817_01570 [Patescibacteria group bacterium]